MGAASSESTGIAKAGPYSSRAMSMMSATIADAGVRIGKHCVRLIVEDRIGVLAEIAAAMRDAGVSIESLIQRGSDDDSGVVIVLVTHEGPARTIYAALDFLAASEHVVGTPMHMPILAL